MQAASEDDRVLAAIEAAFDVGQVEIDPEPFAKEWPLRSEDFIPTNGVQIDHGAEGAGGGSDEGH